MHAHHSKDQRCAEAEGQSSTVAEDCVTLLKDPEWS